MKKALVTIMTLLFLLNIGTVALATPANPFGDVPMNHWAYDAVSKLVKDGIIDGYSDRTFRGERAITRYEMAQMVARAIWNVKKADAADKMLIDKLSAEFSSELNSLGVRVAALEKLNPNGIKFSGWDRIRYQVNDTLQGYTNGPGTAGTSGTVGAPGVANPASVHNYWRAQNDFVLNLSSHLNDTMDFNASMYFRVQDSAASTNNTGGSTSSTPGTANNLNVQTREGSLSFCDLYVTFKDIMPLSNLQLGRLHVKLANGMMFGGDYFDGSVLTFGNKVKGLIGYGDYTYMPGPDMLSNTVSGYTPAKAKIGQLSYSYNDNTTFYLAYMGSANNTLYNLSVTGVQNALPAVLFNVIDFGFASNITPLLQWTGEYAKNNGTGTSILASGDKIAWYTGLRYGLADKNKPGTSDVYVKYFRRGAAAVDERCEFQLFNPTFTQGTNVEGTTLGYDYTIAKNAIVNVEYAKYKEFLTATNNDGGYAKNYRPYVALNLLFWF